MRTRHLIATVLVRLYPAAWRSEYGSELTDVLEARPLSPRVIGDVVWNGLWQRVRAAEPSTLFGLASMLVILSGFVLSAGRYDDTWTAVLRPSSKTFPTVTVTLLASEFYVILLIVCGCWTHLRYGGTASQSGVAAMRMSLVASIPVIVAGVLVAFGLLDVMFAGPAGAATAWSKPGFISAYSGAQLHTPSPLAIIVAPLARLPESWIWGAIGGRLGRRISRSRRTAAA